MELDRAAKDYAAILRNISLENEIRPICLNIEEMLARLDEFETLLTNVKSETTGILADHVSSILSFQSNFEYLKNRIDTLEKFMDTVNDNVSEVDRSLDIAEQELNVADYSLKGMLLKPLFAKVKSVSSHETASEQFTKSNMKDGEFQKVPIFSTDEYFSAAESLLTEK